MNCPGKCGHVYFPFSLRFRPGRFARWEAHGVELTEDGRIGIRDDQEELLVH